MDNTIYECGDDSHQKFFVYKDFIKHFESHHDLKKKPIMCCLCPNKGWKIRCFYSNKETLTRHFRNVHNKYLCVKKFQRKIKNLEINLSNDNILKDNIVNDKQNAIENVLIVTETDKPADVYNERAIFVFEDMEAEEKTETVNEILESTCLLKKN